MLAWIGRFFQRAERSYGFTFVLEGAWGEVFAGR
jgi:hypothetical protein